jgi:hypothetical protein
MLAPAIFRLSYKVHLLKPGALCQHSKQVCKVEGHFNKVQAGKL